MSEMKAAKITLTWIAATLSVYLGALALPLILLMLSMLIDYGTGLMAAAHRKDSITSYRSIYGIAKKVCNLLLVAIGLVLDYLIFYGREIFGLSFSWSFVIAAVITVWITINEIISILENMQDIGVVFPAWLLPFVRNLQGKVSGVVTENEKRDNV